MPHKVFILDLLPEFEINDFRNDIQDQQKLQESIIKVYKELGCDPTIVPVLSIKKRTDFILERVKFNN